MSMEFPETFNPQTEEGNTWDLIPVGEYAAQAIEATVAPPKSGDGFALTLIWKILEGDFGGRQIWQHVTFQHSNEQAQTIGRKQIKDICIALDINEAVPDASVFLFKPARIRVGIQKDKNGIYSDQNRISRVLAANDTPKPDSGAKASIEPEVPIKPAARTQGAPRPGPTGTAPWHVRR